MIRLGFTGSQKGMTEEQIESLNDVFRLFPPGSIFNEGMCIGADDQAAKLAYIRGFFIEGWPSNIKDKTAKHFVHLKHLPKEPLDRNDDIVASSSALIATPAQNNEEQRSGTWATVRRARKAKIPIIHIWPDGQIETRYPDGDVRYGIPISITEELA